MPVLAQSSGGKKHGATAEQPTQQDEQGRITGWALCEADPLAALILPKTNAPADGPTEYLADSAMSSAEEARLEGNVQVHRGDTQLEAPLLTLDRQANVAHAPDGLRAGTPSLAVTAKRGAYAVDEHVGDFSDAQYYVPQRNAQGEAAHIVDRRDQQTTELEQVTYSTCARGKEFWRVRANEMNLDHAAGRGEAWHAKVDFGGVPVLYLPYLSFPINNERQSGFLAPSLGFDTTSGLDLAVPYYWNIAPNQDATFTPRVITQRGLLVGSEYRFLNPSNSGEIGFEYLPNDREAERERSFLNLNARGQWGILNSTLKYEWVSDSDYFRDLGNGLNVEDTAYLERRLDTYIANPYGNLLLRFRGYQTLDGEDFTRTKQYSQLPQLVFWNNWGNVNELNYELRAEAVRFTHPTFVEGTRFDLEPAVSLPLSWSYAFLTPRVALRQTNWQLDYPGATPTGYRDSPNRTAPVISVDSGLIFERDVNFGGQGYVQTLEPRLYYLRVPYRKQSDIPIFDTTLYTENFNWLFYENRFAGADRLGDANQLTTAISTRVLSAEDGRERMRVSIGQINYFSDPRVTLGADSTVDGNRSDFVAEATMTLDRHWYARASTLWDPDSQSAKRYAADLRYRGDSGQILNLSYRYSDDPTQKTIQDTDLEQIDLSSAWPLNASWKLFGRYSYSLLYDNPTDVFAGVEYGDCCWAVRLLARQYRNYPTDVESKNAMFLELELKGLSSIGASADKFLSKSILDYSRQ